MNPNIATPHGISGPEQMPPTEQPSSSAIAPEVAALTAGERLAPQPGVPAMDLPQMALPGQHPVQAMTPSGNPVSQALTTPPVAADNDSIEKEWVLKAKEIIAATLRDPYQQNRQLAAVKADYMKKRYNKTVKLSD